MTSTHWTIGLVASLALLGCGDDDAVASGTTAGAGANGANGGAGATGGTGAGGDDAGGAGGQGATGGTGTGGQPTCTAALEQALGPIDAVSDGAVTILEQEGDVVTLFVDATAGGFTMVDANPWVYVELAGGTRVDVTDPAALESPAWDIAFKRPLLRTNSGVSGPGNGGAAILDGAAFDTVTLAQARAATLEAEMWFDAECNLMTDATGAIATAFDGWYDYENTVVTPHPGTWIVGGADGALYKLELIDYYANPDGTTGGATSARYLLRYAPL